MEDGVAVHIEAVFAAGHLRTFKGDRWGVFVDM